MTVACGKVLTSAGLRHGIELRTSQRSIPVAVVQLEDREDAKRLALLSVRLARAVADIVSYEIAHVKRETEGKLPAKFLDLETAQDIIQTVINAEFKPLQTEFKTQDVHLSQSDHWEEELRSSKKRKMRQT